MGPVGTPRKLLDSLPEMLLRVMRLGQRQAQGLETLGGELDSGFSQSPRGTVVLEAWAASSCLALPGLGEGGPEEGGKGGRVGGEPVVGCLERSCRRVRVLEGAVRQAGGAGQVAVDRPAGGPSRRGPKQRAGFAAAIEADSEGGSSWATLGVRVRRGDSAK